MPTWPFEFFQGTSGGGGGGGGGGTIIKSIQPFAITIPTSASSATTTISSVTTGNAVICYGGFNNTTSAGASENWLTMLALTNSTTVTATRGNADSTSSVTIYGTVVEFTSAALNSSVQTGTITIASGATTGTATISSVSTSQAVVFFLGSNNTTTSTSLNQTYARVSLTNSTTVTATRNSTGTPVITVGYAVVEFASSVINSIQSGSLTSTSANTSDTVTISSVNTGNAILIYGGCGTNNISNPNFNYNVQLTSSTQLTYARTGTATSTRTINYTVLEFAGGIVNSLQRNTTAVASATSANATITSVNTSKSFCNYNGFSTTATSTDEVQAAVELFSATDVRSLKDVAGTTTSTTGWEVIQFN